MFESLGTILSVIVVTSVTQLENYLPKFLAGLFILGIGLVVASVLHRLIIEFFKVVQVEEWLDEAHIAKANDVRVWPQIFAEFVRWSAIILFLVPAAEVWGVPRVTEVLNQVLLYIPNVFVAVFIGLVGLAIANIVYDVVHHGARSIGSTSAGALATVARYAIIFFTTLVVLNQLGVAAELIRILFTGIVAMLALAGGLAFGLGGQDTAKDILKNLRQKIGLK